MSSSIEEQLAHKHVTPKGVEQYGVEPVPEDLRTVTWFDLGAIMFTFVLNPLVFLLCGLGVLVGNLPFWPAFLAPIVGTALTFVVFVILGTFGVDYGIPGQVGARSFFGNWGGRIFTSAFRILSSIFFYASVTLSGTLGIHALLKGLTGIDVNYVVMAVILAVLQSFIAIIGFDVMKIFVRIVAPLMTVVLAMVAIYLITADDPSFAWGYVQSVPDTTFTWTAFGLSASLVAGSWMSTITDAADICRYAKNRVHMWIGYWVGAVVATAFMSFLGVYAASAIKDWNPYAAVATLQPNSVVVILMIIALLLQMVSVNILNHYTGGFSLVNSIPRLGRFWATIIIAIFAITATAFPTFINDAEKYVLIMGNLAGPIGGVMLTDYLLFKKTHIAVADLFQRGRYWYIGGFNPVAIISVFVGFAGFNLIPGAWIPTLASLVFTSVLYYILVHIFRLFWEPMRLGTMPAESQNKVDEEEIIALGKEKGL